MRRLLRLAAVVLLVYGGLLVLTFLGFKTVPVGFIPTAGPGLPDRPGPVTRRRLPATLGRTGPANGPAGREVPGVNHTVEVMGFSGVDGTNRSNAVTTFRVLAPFEEREKDPKENGFAILAEVQRRFATLQKGRALVFPPPPVQGIGNAGGFKLQVEDRRAAGLPALQAATDALIGKTLAQPGIATAFTTFRSQAPSSIWTSTAAKPRRWACRSTRSSVPCRATWVRPT